ncbi:MAG: hypothetical protein K2V38_26450 [Gemmataceae bacterium]|nr:hypothetical protein [Gemmataceae bacterium]
MATEPPTSPMPEDIESGMAKTRKHLGRPVRALGNRVVGMASDASEAGAGAVQGVQDAIKRAGASVTAVVKRVLDVRGRVRRHLWLAVGCADALGYSCGNLLRRR